MAASRPPISTVISDPLEDATSCRYWSDSFRARPSGSGHSIADTLGVKEMLYLWDRALGGSRATSGDNAKSGGDQ